MSTNHDYLRDFYQELGQILADAPEISLPLNRALLNRVHEMAAEPVDVSYEQVDAGGRPAIWCHPSNAEHRGVIVYFHGGGFVVQSIHSHRKLAGHLARAAGRSVLVYDYRQAPEHQYPAQLDDVEQVYSWLLSQGVEPAEVAFAGDSAGACLAVSGIARLRDQGVELPAAVLGFSPWFDLECNGASLEANAATDVLVQRPLVLDMAMAYLGANGSATDPAANPLHADLDGFPPVYLTASASEALVDNAERFAQRARVAGIEVQLELSEDQQHVFQFMAGRNEVADRSIAQAGAWLAAKLVGAPAVRA